MPHPWAFLPLRAGGNLSAQKSYVKWGRRLEEKLFHNPTVATQKRAAVPPDKSDSTASPHASQVIPSRSHALVVAQLKQRGHALAHPHAHRGYPVTLVLIAHSVQQRRGDAGAACAQWVADGDRATARVDPFFAEP